MVVEWTPSHPGRWLFHCHYVAHTFTDGRVPIYGRRIASVHAEPERVAGTPLPVDPQSAMPGMAGLVMAINVLPKPDISSEERARNPRKLELVLQPDSADGTSKGVACSIHDGNQVITSHERSAGPPLVLTRDEPVEITVVNRLNEPTTVHWHGIQLDSYYDGVMGGGLGDQVTPAIAPGTSFVARFTPARAGTFIYHEHGSDPWQLAQGVFGAIIVLNPGQKYDPQHEVLMVIGADNLGFGPKLVTINGSDTFPEMSLQHGADYRVRVVNIAPSLEADITLGSSNNPLTWREIAKDGTQVPARLAKPENAFVHIVSGETYDFELRVDKPGEIPVDVVNWIYKTKVAGEIVVH
jgi:multicopper oxidase